MCEARSIDRLTLPFVRAMDVLDVVPRTLCRATFLVGTASICASSGFAQVVHSGKPSGNAAPDFGSHVVLFAPGMPQAQMQAKIDAIYAEQGPSEFGPGRYAILLQPGQYSLDIPLGFYTQLAGLGRTPDAVHVTGNVHADAALANNNATTTFWRSAENLAVTPAGGTLQWAVSQAVSFRRMHVLGDVVLHQHRGWASGGWMADTLVEGTVESGTQQQWISRNTDWRQWTGSNWNMVFAGTRPPPSGNWPNPPFTKLPTVALESEKPFLQVNGSGHYSVFVPALLHNTAGPSWTGGRRTPGEAIALDRFYIAHPERDTASSMNRALAGGKHLLLTPGTYDLDRPLRVERPGTVVLGLGFATLHPVSGTAALETADADGISLSGLLLDAGSERSPVLLHVGTAGSHRTHRGNPIALHDVFFRVGGAGVGKVGANLVIDSDDTVIDHTWIWRADHGAGVGWTSNTSDNGMIVNADRVTAYGLFVEHHQRFQVLWNGEAGRTIFYQSEIPYDPPNQASWTSAPGVNGWASYKVRDGVRTHAAWGLGVYSVFRHPNVVLSRAIEAPRTTGVCFEHMTTVALDNLGQITHVIDDVGAAAITDPRNTPRVDSFPVSGTDCRTE